MNKLDKDKRYTKLNEKNLFTSKYKSNKHSNWAPHNVAYMHTMSIKYSPIYIAYLECVYVQINSILCMYNVNVHHITHTHTPLQMFRYVVDFLFAPRIIQYREAP